MAMIFLSHISDTPCRVQLRNLSRFRAIHAGVPCVLTTGSLIGEASSMRFCGPRRIASIKSWGRWARPHWVAKVATPTCFTARFHVRIIGRALTRSPTTRES